MGDKRTSKQIQFHCEAGGGVNGGWKETWNGRVRLLMLGDRWNCKCTFLFFSPFYTNCTRSPSASGTTGWRNWNLCLRCPLSQRPSVFVRHLSSNSLSRREAIQVFMGGLRMAFCTERRADQALQKAHWGEAIQMQSLWQVSVGVLRAHRELWGLHPCNLVSQKSEMLMRFFRCLNENLSDTSLIWFHPDQRQLIR